ALHCPGLSYIRLCLFLINRDFVCYLFLSQLGCQKLFHDIENYGKPLREPELYLRIGVIRTWSRF
ncbi:MAG TPA: hypothetical protein PLF23_22525, partial [Candidatus Obscuribacter sp.]|nr:hypothetical protein [Candidatus Obscuribacter sp.]